MILAQAFVIFTVTLSLTDAIVLRKNKLRINNKQCQDLRCSDATNIAGRLSKLALLPDFVTETLKLLENLMQEMEIELRSSADFLLEQMEPSCASLREEMKPILKKKKKRSGRKREELGMDIQPHINEDSVWQAKFSNSSEDMYYSQKERKLNGDDFRHPSAREDSDWPAIPNDKEKWSSDSSDWHGSHSSTNQHKWSDEADRDQTNVHANKRMWSAEDYEPQREDKYEKKWSEVTNSRNNKWDVSAPEKKWHQSSSNRGSSIDRSYSGNENTGQSQDSKYSESRRTSESRRSHSREKHDRDDNNPGKKYILDTQKKHSSQGSCRGIDKQSPFWVPGLDQWCVTNCAAGYCPETHCIC